MYPANCEWALIAADAGIPIVGDLETGVGTDFDHLCHLVDHLIVPLSFVSASERSYPDHGCFRQLWHERRQLLCVTNGKHGCWWTTDGQTVHYQPAIRPSDNDSTGAGDVFHGAYAETLRMSDMSTANRIEIAAATASLKINTGQLPTWDEVTALTSTPVTV